MPKDQEHMPWKLPMKVEPTVNCRYTERIMRKVERYTTISGADLEDVREEVERMVFLCKHEMYSNGLADMDKMHNAVMP